MGKEQQSNEILVTNLVGRRRNSADSNSGREDGGDNFEAHFGGMKLGCCEVGSGYESSLETYCKRDVQHENEFLVFIHLSTIHLTL